MFIQNCRMDLDFGLHKKVFNIAQAQKLIRKIRRFECERNENPIRYVFGAGTRAIRYSVDIALY